MGVSERKIRQKQELRSRIVDTARRLFAEHGVEAVSMRKIAAEIEYSAPAIYLYFPDKESLLREICHTDFDALAGSFAKLSGVADPVERIRLIGLAYMKFAVNHPQHYRLMFMTPVEHSIKPSEQDLARKGDPSHDGYAFLRRAVGEGLSAGAFRDEVADIELLCQTFWAAVHGVAALTITHRKDEWITWRSLDRRMHAMADAVLRGLVKPGAFPGETPLRSAWRGRTRKVGAA